ncbi:hypothetical protein J4214_04420 [Candidatus Woesearchaeota archaeon]|nr:hypothetical protein [Candidatus Woesearchaeota archaeon]
MSLSGIVLDNGIDFDSRDISYKVNDVLNENKINIQYNPERQTCRTWYGRELKIEYVAKGKLSGGKLHSKKLTIDILKYRQKIRKTPERIAATLLHEKIHHDIGIIETPASVYGLIKLSQTIENPLNAILVTGLAALIYILIREFIVDGISYARYGLCDSNSEDKKN